MIFVDGTIITFRCHENNCYYIPEIYIKNVNNEQKIKTICRKKHEKTYNLDLFLKESLDNSKKLPKISKDHDSKCLKHEYKKILGYNKEYGNICPQCKRDFKIKDEEIHNFFLSNEEENKFKEEILKNEQKIDDLNKKKKELESEIVKLQEALKTEKNLLEIKMKLYEIYKKEISNKNYCFEIIENVKRIFNEDITINSDNYSVSNKPSEIITLNSLNHCQYCNYILDYQDKNLSIITINENNHKKKMDKKFKCYFIPPFGLPSTYIINLPEIKYLKDITSLLLKSNNNLIHLFFNELIFYNNIKDSEHNLFIEIPEKELITEIIDDVYVSPKIMQRNNCIPLYIFLNNKDSSFPRILLLEQNLSFEKFLQQIYFYLRKYLINTPSDKKFNKLINKLDDIDSFCEIISFMKEEFDKIINREDEYNQFNLNNLPFQIYIRKFKEKKLILKDGFIDRNLSVNKIIKKIQNDGFNLCVDFNVNSNYFNKIIRDDFSENIDIEMDSIHQSLEHNNILCPYCKNINEFYFEKNTSENYLFVLNKTIEFHNSFLFLENVNLNFDFYEKENILNIDINQLINEVSLDEDSKNELIKFINNNINNILFFKKNKNKKVFDLFKE